MDEARHVIALLADGMRATDTAITLVDATDPDCPLVYVNTAFQTLTGYPGDQLLGRNSRFLHGPATSADAAGQLDQALRTGQPAHVRLLNYRADGTTWWNDLHLSPVRDSSGALTHVLGIGHDVTEQVAAEQEAAHAARHDPLTGLATRLAFIDQLERDLARAGRDHRAVAVLFLDIDDFKAVNDTGGHASGDAVLVEVADRLRNRLRGEDLAARHGGDEFLVLLVDLPGDGTTAAEAVLTELGRALAEPLHLPGTQDRVRVSLGLSVFPRDGKTSDELIAAADRDMYRHKAHRHPGSTATRRGSPARPTGPASPDTTRGTS
jgi:diguanylate cyclase (GGDEF)-like protein/PAS domain S-box-containing protein